MPTTPSPDDLAAKARFVFRGTVQKLNASTLPEVHDTSKTAVVRVDATVQAPKTLSHYTGKDITVRVDDPGELKVGQEAVFFADAWLFGHAESLCDRLASTYRGRRRRRFLPLRAIR